MRRHPFTATAFFLGAVLMVWSALPWEDGQKAFHVFIVFYGPSLVFSLAVVTLVLLRNRKWQAVWLLPFSPFLYYGGGHLLFRDDRFGVLAPFLASLLTALVYLAASRLLIFQRCRWSIVWRWGSVSLIAGIPFVYPIFTLAKGWLANFWFWGLHLLLWYTAVSYALDRMADQDLQPSPANAHG